LVILPNSNIVSGSWDETIKIWQSESLFECIATLYGHTYTVNTLAILPNSNIVSGSGDTTFKIWTITEFIILNSKIVIIY
jgi:WD40 repeat protein